MQIRVSFINEHGEEEAGIDGGGIFKDFMENITRAAFDVQYGLFKVSPFWVELIYPVQWYHCSTAAVMIIILCVLMPVACY